MCLSSFPGSKSNLLVPDERVDHGQPCEEGVRHVWSEFLAIYLVAKDDYSSGEDEIEKANENWQENNGGKKAAPAYGHRAPKFSKIVALGLEDEDFITKVSHRDGEEIG